MHRFFVTGKITNNEIAPSTELFHQLKNILKMNKYEKFIIINNEIEYYAYFNGKNIKTIESLVKKEDLNLKQVILVQSTIKNSKLSFLLQKITEIGVTKIIFFQSKRSIPKINDYQSKKERFDKIVEEASEQSNRIKVPEIIFKTNFNDINFEEGSLILIAYENEQNYTIKDFRDELKNSDKIYLVVGPEGGIEEEEILLWRKQWKNIKIVSLNKNILRSETAAISFCTIINYEIQG